MRKILLLLAAFAWSASPSMAGAQARAYPTKPIHWVVPYAPGGATDRIARVMAQKLTESLGQPVIVDNRPGAGSTVGTEYVAKQPGDGYTLLLTTIATHAIAPNLQKVSYDPIKDFAPIMEIARGPFVVAVNPNAPIRSIKELVALAKAQPGKLAFGTGGPGSPQNLAVEIFKSITGTQMVSVPYRGGGQAVTELIGGQTQFMFDNTVVEHVKAGKLRAIATTGASRMEVLPDVPTVRESGIDYEFYAWQGVSAPAGTPPEVIRTLHAAMAKALTLPDVRKALTSDGGEIVGDTPEHFSSYIQAEYSRMKNAIQAAGISAE